MSEDNNTIYDPLGGTLPDMTEQIPKPRSEEEYNLVNPGQKWMDPEGKVRSKPYKPDGKED